MAQRAAAQYSCSWRAAWIVVVVRTYTLYGMDVVVVLLAIVRVVLSSGRLAPAPLSAGGLRGRPSTVVDSLIGWDLADSGRGRDCQLDIDTDTDISASSAQLRTGDIRTYRSDERDTDYS